MRSIVIIASLGIILLLSGVCFAETNAECMTRCAAERALRDEGCPPAAYDGDPVRAQCLQESNEAFTACMAGCPQPETPTDQPTVEKAE